MQARGDLVRPELADRVGNLELAAVERRAQLTLDGVGHVSGRDGPIQPPLRARLRLQHHRLCLEAGLEGTRVLLFLGRVARRRRLQVGHLLEGSRGGRHRQTARDQVVARVPVGHVFDLAGASHVGHVAFEQHLHRGRAPLAQCLLFIV